MSQLAGALQVAVPPEQSAVSVWLLSRLQVRVWVPSPLDFQSPQL